jgi:hypothetical protein
MDDQEDYMEKYKREYEAVYGQPDDYMKLTNTPLPEPVYTSSNN